MKDFFLPIIGLIMAGVIIIGVILLPVSRMEYKAKVVEYKAFSQTLESARQENISELERATMLKEIAKWNMGIESARYWRRTIFKVYIPKQFTELELLK